MTRSHRIRHAGYQQSRYNRLRAAQCCVKCGAPSAKVRCPDCTAKLAESRSAQARAAWLEADRREEWLALNEIAIRCYVGSLPFVAS